MHVPQEETRLWWKQSSVEPSQEQYCSSEEDEREKKHKEKCLGKIEREIFGAENEDPYTPQGSSDYATGDSE